MVNQLIDIIGREAALFESFLELLQQQRDALVTNNLGELNDITERQHEKLAECRLLNKQREELVAQIKALNAIEGDLTVSRLLDLVDHDQAQRLRDVRDIILDLNGRINDARNTNAMLLNQSREFVSRTMMMLSKLHNPEPTYGRDTRETEPAHAVALDRRA